MTTAGSSDIGTSAPEATAEKTDTPGTEYVPTSPAGKGEKNAAANQRALPNSIDAEVCVLGSMMLDPGTIDIAVHITQGDDFFRPSHRVVYDALCG
ncbi:MAG: hypothetical protein KAV00_13695, partial [Phycisphaerae bacterium]|nr:hypothetical protein [Phycisphaerae bacterium]